MGYQMGSYTDQNNAIDLWRAFLLANGWTINSFVDDGSYYSGSPFTGKRLHVSKSIYGVDRFFNLRSSVSQQVCEDGIIVTGISVNGSTSYESADSWDKQPGFTSRMLPLSDSGSIAGFAGGIDSGDYFFFSSGSSASAVFSRLDGNHVIITIGATDSGCPLYVASGGLADDLAYSSLSTNISVNAQDGNTGIYVEGTGWFIGTTSRLGTVHGGVYSEVNLHSAGPPAYSYAGPYLYYSPSPFRGNAPLPAFSQRVNLNGNAQGVGSIEGVSFINMQNYSNGEEITIGADVYKCFRINNANTYGVAFRK